MPKVPLPQVGGSTSQGPQFSAPGVAPFQDQAPRQLQQLGAATEEAGLAAVGIATMLREEQDVAGSKEAYTQFADYTSTRLEGPDGYLQTQGKKSVGYERAKALGEIEKRAAEIEKGLPNEIQRGRFREGMRHHMLGVREKVFGHEAQQRRVWTIGETKSMAEQSIRDAIDTRLRGETPAEVVAGGEIAAAQDAKDRRQGGQNPNPAPQGPKSGIRVPAPADESLRGRSYADAKAAAEAKAPTWETYKRTAIHQYNELADMMGLPADSVQRQMMVQDATTAIHGGVLSRMLDQDRLKEAKDYLSKVPGEEMNSDVRTKIDKAIASADAEDRALSLSQEILGTIAKPTDPIVSVDGVDIEVMSWDEQVRRSNDPGAKSPTAVDTTTMLRDADRELQARFNRGEISAKERNAAFAYIREQHSLRINEWNGIAQESLVNAEKILQQNPQLSVDSPSFPRSLRSQLEEYGQLDSARRIEGGRRSTSYEDYKQLHMDADSGAFVGMTSTQLFNRYYAKLGPSEWNEAQGLHAAANKTPAPRAIEDDDLFSIQDQMLEIATSAKLLSKRNDSGKPVPMNEVEAKRYVDFRAEVQKRLNAERASGRKMDTAAKAQIASEVAVDKVFIEDDAPFYKPWAFADRPAWQWQSDVTAKDAERGYITSSVSGQNIAIASIPSGARKEIQDAYRMSLLHPDDQKIATQALQQFKATTGEADRDSIEAMWQHYGIASRNGSPQQVGEAWEKMRKQPGSFWATYKEPKK